MTPIAALVKKRQQELALDRKGVCRRLGYVAFGKACSTFDEVMASGVGKADFLVRLASAIEVPTEDVEAAVKEQYDLVRAEQERVARSQFTPHLWVVPAKRVPENITIVGMIGIDRILRVALPRDIAESSFEIQLELVKAAAVKHFVDQRGGVLGFGKVIEYIYRPTFDDAHRISTDGQWLGVAEELPPVRWAGARIAGRSISMGDPGR